MCPNSVGFPFNFFFFLFTVFFELLNYLSLILRDSADNSLIFFPLGGLGWGGQNKSPRAC